MTSNLLDGLYQSVYNKQIESLLKQAKVFGVSVFGDGATIAKASSKMCDWKLMPKGMGARLGRLISEMSILAFSQLVPLTIISSKGISGRYFSGRSL